MKPKIRTPNLLAAIFSLVAALMFGALYLGATVRSGFMAAQLAPTKTAPFLRNFCCICAY